MNNQKLKTEQKMIKKILEMNSYCAEQPYDWWNNRENRTHMINRDACNTADTNKIQIDELLFPPYRVFFLYQESTKDRNYTVSPTQPQFMMLPFQLFYPPKVLAPYANLQALSIFLTVQASCLLLQFSAVELL